VPVEMAQFFESFIIETENLCCASRLSNIE